MARHVLRLARYPGQDAELVIDGIPQRIVQGTLKVDADVTTFMYEDVTVEER